MTQRQRLRHCIFSAQQGTRSARLSLTVSCRRPGLFWSSTLRQTIVDSRQCGNSALSRYRQQRAKVTQIEGTPRCLEARCMKNNILIVSGQLRPAKIRSLAHDRGIWASVGYQVVVLTSGHADMYFRSWPICFPAEQVASIRGFYGSP
jgi:hypothetical protein